MKSTIKIDFAPNHKSIIKIIRPQEVLDLETYPDGDYDVRDKHVNDFLKGSLNCDAYSLFQIGSSGMLKEAPFDVTTIIPVENKNMFGLFRHNILNRLVPYTTLVKLNQNANGSTYTFTQEETDKYHKIVEFFDWLDKQEWASYAEQQPD